MPKIDPKDLCSALQLCSVRQYGNEYFVAVKRLDGSMDEIPFDAIANAESYEDKPIKRVYSSWHVFFNEDRTQIFLTTVEKNGAKQAQFTGGSPLEDANKEVVYHIGREVKFHLAKVEENAVLRTKKRTGVDVVNHYNVTPLVDWALMENMDEDGNVHRKLVCLMHYIVKDFKGKLKAQKGVEYVVDGQWVDIDNILSGSVPYIAPNAKLIVMKSFEMMMQ